MAKRIRFSVDKRIFDTFPEYRRAILVVTNVDNTRVSVLGGDIMDAAKNIKDGVDLKDARIIAWHEAFASLGIKVRDFKPSIDALVRRIHNAKPLGSINPIVDVGTIVSLRFVLPAGAHPIHTDTCEVHLGFADGERIVISEDAGPPEPVSANELILFDNGRVATRCWVWRQASQSRVDENTRNFYLNIDALGIIDENTLRHAIHSSKDIIHQVFERECSLIILSASNITDTVEVE